MKKLIITLAMALAAGFAGAQTVTNLVPNGDFSTPGPSSDWVEVTGGGAFTFSYPTSGGNPDAYGAIEDDSGGAGWAIWVNGNSTPLTLTSLGLNAGITYTFLVDMKVLSGAPNTNLGGFKVDFFNGAGQVGSTGDMRPSPTGHNVANWETYSYSVTIPLAADGVKLVPLWGPKSIVAYDNVRVVVPATAPLSTFITSPANGATVGVNFTIYAAASVLPGSITEVDFYDGATLLGNATTAPYTYDVYGATLGAHVLSVVAKADNGASVTSSVVNVTVATGATVYVDPAKSWQGYLNWYETPQNGGAFAGGGNWGTADLRAVFSGSTLTLSPNSVNDPSGYWYVTTNSPSEANKSTEANFYVEPVGSLPGLTVTFTGKCNLNTLVGDSIVNPAGNGWTCVAFVKDISPDYSSSYVSTVALTNGQVFSVSLDTISDSTRHVQYGFQTVGPCVWATDPVLPSYGNVQVGPLTADQVSIKSSLSGGNLNLSFPTQSGFAYTVQSKDSLAGAVWSTVTVTNGTGSTAVVTTPVSGAGSFYRLSIQ